MAGLILGVIVALAFVWLVSFAVAHRPVLTRDLRDDILEFFAALPHADSALGGVAIDSDWVALKLCKHPLDSKVASLPTKEQAEVVALSDRVRIEGAKMVGDGLLRYMVPRFEKQLPEITFNAPASMFLLAPRGRGAVLALRAKKAETRRKTSS